MTPAFEIVAFDHRISLRRAHIQQGRLPQLGVGRGADGTPDPAEIAVATLRSLAEPPQVDDLLGPVRAVSRCSARQ